MVTGGGAAGRSLVRSQKHRKTCARIVSVGDAEDRDSSPAFNTFDSDIADAEREVERVQRMLGEAGERLAALRDSRAVAAPYYRASAPAPERGPPAVLDRALIAS